jgi:hypothetical protein
MIWRGDGEQLKGVRRQDESGIGEVWFCEASV